MIPMLHRLASLLAPQERPGAHVHFHRGPQGRPAACHDSGCDMPRLDV
jgi:hypothetical protein